MHTQTAMPINRAICEPPLSDSLPNRAITMARNTISTTTGMMATKGWGILLSLIGMQK